MNTKHILLATALLAGSSSIGSAAVTATLAAADLNALNGSASGNFNETFTDPVTGAVVVLNFAFTAAGGTSPVFGIVSDRLGVNSNLNTGSNATTSINDGQSLDLTISFVPTGSTAGLTSVDVNLEEVGLYRSGNGSGTASYTWNSSARTAALGPVAVGGLGPQTPFADDTTFDLLTGNYTGTFSVTQAGTHVEGMRWGSAEIDVTVSAVPEPSSAAVLGLGGLALILRRRK